MNADLLKRLLAQRQAKHIVANISELVSKSPFTIVQVGACTGEESNDPLKESLFARENWIAHLIEPVPKNFATLRRVMQPISHRVFAYNQAITTNDEIRPFYYVSSDYEIDFPDAPHWKKVQIGSLSPHGISQHIPKKYIVEDSLHCVSPGTFIRNSNIQEIDLLITDTEGYDRQIVEAFLEVIQPSFIIYENEMIPAAEHSQFTCKLEESGYVIKHVGPDTVAIFID